MQIANYKKKIDIVEELIYWMIDSDDLLDIKWSE